MNPSIQTAWNTVFNRFFCPETELLYDFVIDDENSAWHHLPTPAKIRQNIPNPCGWGTGMEDSVLNGGNALDALISAYALTKDDSVKPLADALLRGLLRCEINGFVARSLSPADRKSHYIESSRDQYTHYIYAILRFFHSPLCTEEQKACITASFVRIAQKCEREVIPENDYHMLRENGTKGIVGKMYGGLNAHEWLRLPMFYLAAYKVSGDPHWHRLYLKYRDEAFENSLHPLPEDAACYCYLQMQYSLRVLYDYDTDLSFRQKLLPLMNRLAAYGAEKAVSSSREMCKTEHQEEINYRFHAWNKTEHRHMGVFDGYTYDNPAQSERKDNPAFYPVRQVGEGAILAAICPRYCLSDAVLTAVDNMAQAIDYKKHSSIYAPLLLSCAYILCKERQKAEEKI